MAYYGNLALKPERKPDHEHKPAKRTETVVRRRPIPVAEKLLYIFTVALCAVVAGFIVYRYAEIYEINRQIQEINRTYDQLTSQSKALQLEVERMSDPRKIIEEARKLGYVSLDPERQITIGESGRAVAMNTGN